jgi:hypothetical protein
LRKLSEKMAEENDDDFGGFEEANVDQKPKVENLPPPLKLDPKTIEVTELIPDVPPSPTAGTLQSLQNELKQTRHQLTLVQAKHQSELTQKMKEITSAFANTIKSMEAKFESRLSQQRIELEKEMTERLKKQSEEQEKNVLRMVNSQSVFDQSTCEANMSNKLESQLVQHQEKLIKYTDSQLEDTEMKIKNVIGQMIQADYAKEKLNFKMNFEQLERKFKADLEKSNETIVLNQSEILAERLKSSVMQEHLILTDLIKKKLDQIQKNSDEKRKKSSRLYSQHLSGLQFFVDNAHKELSILKEAHIDLKDKDLIDEMQAPTPDWKEWKDKDNVSNNNNNNSTVGVAINRTLAKEENQLERFKKRSTTFFDDNLVDENLLDV